MAEDGTHGFVHSGDWLQYKAEHGQSVTAEDVVRIITENPELIPDAVLRNYIVKGLGGALRGIPGRPGRTTMQKLKLHLAAHQVDVLTRWYKRAKDRGYDYAGEHKREGLSLSQYIHERVARRLKLGGGPSLANAISSLKDGLY